MHLSISTDLRGAPPSCGSKRLKSANMLPRSTARPANACFPFPRSDVSRLTEITVDPRQPPARRSDRVFSRADAPPTPCYNAKLASARCKPLDALPRQPARGVCTDCHAKHKRLIFRAPLHSFMVDINWVSHGYLVQAFSRTCEMPYQRSCPRYSNVISGISQRRFAD